MVVRVQMIARRGASKIQNQAAISLKDDEISNKDSRAACLQDLADAIPHHI